MAALTLLLVRSAFLGAAALSLALPAPAWAHIYKWVDERGVTVYSNVLPEKSPKNAQMVVEEKPADRAPAAEAMRREQQLLERIANLERQLQAQQYQQYPQYIPPPPPSVDYGGYYQGYYPSYPLTYPYAVFTGRFIGRGHSFVSPRFASARVASFHHGGMSRGRR
ncbi:MAG: DUF4124 domain-containing protein [Betaproteobacteria bacterium]|nr:MAG: DUF4124 domain-containing protein [Betaproteobacteria bacterium]